MVEDLKGEMWVWTGTNIVRKNIRHEAISSNIVQSRLSMMFSYLTNNVKIVLFEYLKTFL